MSSASIWGLYALSVGLLVATTSSAGWSLRTWGFYALSVGLLVATGPGNGRPLSCANGSLCEDRLSRTTSSIIAVIRSIT